jgi:hypothetical protein
MYDLYGRQKSMVPFILMQQTHIGPPFLCSKTGSFAIVWVLLAFLLERYVDTSSVSALKSHSVRDSVQVMLTSFERLRNVLVAEPAKSKRPRDLAILFCDRALGRVQRPECIKADEKITFRHIGVGFLHHESKNQWFKCCLMEGRGVPSKLLRSAIATANAKLTRLDNAIANAQTLT